MAAIGFIGSGQMATAMAVGMQSLPQFHSFWFSDVSSSQLEKVKCLVPNARVTQNNSELIQNVNVVVLSVKPQYLSAALKGLDASLTSNHLIVSIMAGVPIAPIRALCGPLPRIIRTMPNTPLLVKKGVVAFAGDEKVTPKDHQLVRQMFEKIALCFPVQEGQLDAVTGVSGSGPAYVAVFMEALADGAVSVGIPRDLAVQMAANTIYGSAAMIAEKGTGVTQPSQLKDMVCSPGGTSIRGVHALEKGGMRAAVMDCVQAATSRSKELGVEAVKKSKL